MDTKYIIYLVILLLFGSFYQIKAQEIRTNNLYSELQNYEISKDGKWALVRKSYKSINSDSVYVINTQSNAIIKKQSQSRISLFDNSLLCIQSINGDVEFLNLNTNKKILLSEVDNLKIVKESNLLFYLDKKTNDYKLSIIKDDKLETIWIENKENVDLYDLNVDRKTLLVQTRKSNDTLTRELIVINLSTLKKTVTTNLKIDVSKIIWDNTRPIVYCINQSKNGHSIYVYDYNKNHIYTIEAAAMKDSMENIISIESLDNEKVLINYSATTGTKSYDTSNLEIWSTNDLNLEKKTNKNSPLTKVSRYIIVNVNTNEIENLNELENQTAAALDSNQIIYFDLNQYYDYKYTQRPTDLKLYNLETHSITTVGKQIPNIRSSVSVSPNRNFIIFKKDETWYSYNTKTKSILAICESDYGQNKLYWSKDSKLLYLNTNKGLAVYSYPKKAIQFLINNKNRTEELSILNPYKDEFNLLNISSNSLVNDENILIHRRDNSNNTHALELIESGKNKLIVPFTKDKITSIKSNDSFKVIAYRTENYNKPHAINLVANNQNKVLLESDMPQELYSWRKQKVVEYKDLNNDKLKGVLFYPKEFDSFKKYPMITRIYQILNKHSNSFFFPSMNNSDGMNIQVLLEKGYFVFYADIKDNDLGTGKSALYCVEQAIQKVVEQEKSIDKNKLGLMGHSHGGYKTNFIITQTNIFKAAVSGAGNSDLVRSYFSYNNNFSKPFYFQFETGQYNMPGSFKDYKQMYLNNSPILYVDQVKTPLLSWSGMHDQNIESDQTKEFFMGLQRNKIPHIALFYKNEGHTLLDSKNSEDLTSRIINWFDYFLKDEKTSQWITDGVTFDKERMTPY
ncbi:S9 family peptidase [Flavobacterium sp. HSC-61S13]|uniref:alpha/beta hydrolase family protein n=1 Tax=Flavobacterium sp. HSC-61S13 TaxID=2910963 RepID=UPI00209F382A|nr:prolyl oligopeptidase family serine peptidase [Flavobacterium sp. HSC-61S13]MCP1994351.1 dipeptidyl aminopeptidase/acylaminoacyl peptidase [Flavobacterium sp. HSC-61S13]